MTDHDPNRDLDAWLKTAHDPEPSAHLLRSIAEVPLRHPRAEGLAAWWPFGSVWRGAAVATLALALGVLAGTATTDDTVTQTLAAAEAVDDGSNVTDSITSMELAFAWPLDEELSP